MFVQLYVCLPLKIHLFLFPCPPFSFTKRRNWFLIAYSHFEKHWLLLLSEALMKRSMRRLQKSFMATHSSVSVTRCWKNSSPNFSYICSKSFSWKLSVFKISPKVTKCLAAFWKKSPKTYKIAQTGHTAPYSVAHLNAK